MRRLLVLVLFGAAFSLAGYVTTGVSLANEAGMKGDAARPLIKCSTCGVEFTSQAGLVEHVKANPGHEAAAAGSVKPLIKCATCGTLFTSSAGVVDHLKAYPTHKFDSSKPLVKCSTCGVEFTSSGLMAEHMKAHPGHEMGPVE